MSITIDLATTTTSSAVLAVLARHLNPNVRLAAVKNSHIRVKALVERLWNDKNEAVRVEADRRLRELTI